MQGVDEMRQRLGFSADRIRASMCILIRLCDRPLSQLALLLPKALVNQH